MTERDELESLMNISKQTSLDDAASNAAIRSTFRADRKKKKKRLKDAKAMGWKEGMELAEETNDDVALARATCFGKGKDAERAKFRSLRKSSIFDTSKRKSRKRARGHVRPDNMSSVSSNSQTVASNYSETVVQREESIEKKRIRLVPSGSKLKRDNATVSKEASASTSLSTLLVNYGSDSD
jgi:hypothetical protein